MRLAGRSAATSIFLRRTMPRSITVCLAAAKKPKSAGVSPVSSSSAMRCEVGFSPSIQPRNCQIARKSSIVLISGVPVSAIIRARGERDRMLSASASTCLERCDSRFLMKCASSTTMPLNPRVRSQPTCRSSTS